MKKYARTDKAKAVAYKTYLKRTYGITVDKFNKLLIKQGGTCANCYLPETAKDNKGGIKQLSVDHDHLTGKVRWLLCHNCNWGLGAFKDNPTLLRHMANLLDNAKDKF